MDSAAIKQTAHAFGADLCGITAAEPQDLLSIKNRTIPGPDGLISIRAYLPEGNPPCPILIFFHGGGFVLGTLDEFDSLCSYIAPVAFCVVVSVDYRLAPEHK
jgi:acetyl esterase